MPFTSPLRALLLLCFRDLRHAWRQMECAELLLASGLTDEARLLYEVVFIQTGFLPDHVRTQREIAERTKLWRDQTWDDADLAEPAEMTQRHRIASLQIDRLLELRGYAEPASPHTPENAAVASAGLADILTRLCTALRRPLRRETHDEIAALLAWVRLHVTGKDAFSFDGNAGAGLPVLAAGLARNALRAFILTHYDLIEGTAGSPAVFHEAARMPTAGLGSYLTQAMTLAAGDGDGLAAIRRLLHGDRDCASSSAELVQRGIVLSLGLRGGPLANLVDVLADGRGMLAIHAIFARVQAAGVADQDLAPLERIRAAGLHAEDFDLALRAQKVIVQARPNSAGDWIILGNMQTATGNRSAAETAYKKSLRIQPQGLAANQRLEALCAGRMTAFMTVGEQECGTYGGSTMQRQPADPCDVVQRTLRKYLYCLALAPTITQIQIDCAEIAYAAGFTGAARTLYDVIFVVSGFSPSAIERQRNVEQRLGLWDQPQNRTTGVISRPAAASSSPKPAIEQLASIIAEAGRTLQPIPPLQTRMIPVRAEPDRAKPGQMPESGSRASSSDLHVFCAQLKLALRQPLSSQSSASLRQALTWLERHVFGQPPVPADSYCTLDIQAMAGALAFNIMRDFAFGIRDLAYGPFGSPELFHGAARLNEAGLGPYFSRSGDLLSDTRDVFGFIQLALNKTTNIEPRRDALERWSVLLSTGFGNEPLRRLVDELADLGLVRAIRAICSRASQQSTARFDAGVMWSIRDAGLDNADFDLASQAQQVVVGWRPEEVNEWIVLGEIQATADNPKAAAEAFGRALGLDPTNRAAQERLDALETGGFDRFRIAGGYGTPEARKRLRRSRLRAA